MINKRIFGSDIPDKIKKKLEIRQAFAQSANPGESLDKINEKYKDINIDLDNDFDNQADLGSRTPFVRMWTAVEVFNREISTQQENEFIVGKDEDIAEVTEKVNRLAGQYRTQEGVYLNEILYDDNDGSPRYVIKGKEIIEEKQRIGDPKIYIIGNHNLNTLSALTPNESIADSNNDVELLYGVNRSDVLPDEHGISGDNNQYLKPPAGITGFSSTTEGPLGVMRKTTVNFTVHNFHDFESIYQRYFLRPGAQIFVDYGWNNKVLYDPENLVIYRSMETEEDTQTDLTVEEMLYGESENENEDRVTGYITAAQGDLDTVIGYVTNYDAKVLENGSVECSVEITSKNIALLSEKFDNAGRRKKRIEHQLTIGILRDGLIAGSSLSDRDFLNQRLNSLSPKTKESFNRGIRENAEKNLSFDSLNLTDTNIKTGVGISNIGDSAIYISIGYLEDEILNPEFGVGVDIDNVKTGTDTQIRIDSSESFSTYSYNLYKRQKFMGQSDEQNPAFLYPYDWRDTYNTNNYKTPQYPEDVKDNESQYDMSLDRIPIRELFVKTDTVKDALNKDNVVDAIKEILNAINEDSGDILKLSISNNGSDNTISIIDTNFVPFERGIQEESQAFDNLFEFSVMSSNSIVKGYDLGFKMPEGGIANMIAIQGMSSQRGSQIFPINSMIDEGIALEVLNSLFILPEEEQELHKFNKMGVGYLPDMGSYKADKFASDIKIDNRETYGYSEADNTLDKYFPISTQFDIDYTYFNTVPEVSEDTTSTTTTDVSKNHDNLLNSNIEEMEIAGYIVASSFSDYYLNKARADFLIHKRPTPLPLTLSLTIYGISSIQPGDVFRVDYLPKNYRKLVYFQVMKVSHTVDSSGWYTTLETQFRLKSNVKLKANLYFKPTNICISPKKIDQLTILKRVTEQPIDNSPTVLENISELSGYMGNIQLVAPDTRALDYIFEFTALGDKSEIETDIAYWLDFKITKNGSVSQLGSPTIQNADIHDKLTLLDDVNRAELKKSSEPIADNGLTFYYWKQNKSIKDKYDVIWPFIKPIKLIKNKTYQLFVKDHRWIVYTPGSKLKKIDGSVMDVDETKSLVISLLNAGAPLKEKRELREECAQCKEYEEEQCKEQSNYCVWEAPWFDHNKCVNREVDSCYK